ncbi:MAG: helix-turn-helix domain-containing protein [Halobacteriales archaeon]
METAADLLSGAFDRGRDREIYVEMSIRPTEECGCPAAEAARRGADVTDVRRTQMDGSCRSDVVVNEDGELRTLNAEKDLDDSCFCPSFEEIGLVPRIAGVEGGRILLSMYVSTRDDLKRALDAIRDSVDDVKLERMSLSGDADETVSVDLSNLTEKQADTLRKAFSWGYYDDPSGVGLAELAEEFQVSKSAVSQRLKRAESKLVSSALTAD